MIVESPVVEVEVPVPRFTTTCSPIVELRQYTLHPNRRDVLISLFEREFLDTQAEAGIAVLGQFRDLDADDRFVWLRGFQDMERVMAVRPHGCKGLTA